MTKYFVSVQNHAVFVKVGSLDTKPASEFRLGVMNTMHIIFCFLCISAEAMTATRFVNKVYLLWATLSLLIIIIQRWRGDKV